MKAVMSSRRLWRSSVGIAANHGFPIKLEDTPTL
jgi:hypothetical protein